MRVCEIEGCGAKHMARGWCHKHYNRWRAHGDPLTRKTQEHRAGAASRICSRCHAEKSLDQFHEVSTMADGRNSQCKSCHNRGLQISRYGITEAEWHALYERQDGRCAICGTAKCTTGRRLGVDHDHETGKVRGLLCNLCNPGLGNFKDNPERLRRAITYLEAATGG